MPRSFPAIGTILTDGPQGGHGPRRIGARYLDHFLFRVGWRRGLPQAREARRRRSISRALRHRQTHLLVCIVKPINAAAKAMTHSAMTASGIPESIASQRQPFSRLTRKTTPRIAIPPKAAATGNGRSPNTVALLARRMSLRRRNRNGTHRGLGSSPRMGGDSLTARS